MPSRRNSLSLLLPLAAALGLLGCAQTVRDQPSIEQLEENANAVQAEYLIGANDSLSIYVWKEQELSLPRVDVRLDGKISVPLIDDVQAAGLTPTQLKASITERLKEFVTAPQVTVIVTQSGSKIVYVLGEVQREGAVGMQPQMRVIDALALAGGFTPFAGKTRVKIIREKVAPAAEFNFDYDRFVDGADVAQNILLLPGDQIIVPQERPFWR